MEIQVALAQMRIIDGRPDQNEAAALKLAAEAVARRCDLLVLPELWPTGYDLDRAPAYASPLDRGAFGLMADVARSHGMYVAGTALEANPAGPPFNTAALYGPRGERVGFYRKIHLFPPMGETRHLAPGEAMPVFQLPWGLTALAVCYDLRFPELWRCYMEAGARLIVVPAEWPARRAEHWRLLLRARAVENQLFVAGCNRAGEATGAPDGYAGFSAAVDPWGQLLVEGDTAPGLFVARLDLDEVERCRELFPFLNDRRPELYRSAGAW